MSFTQRIWPCLIFLWWVLQWLAFICWTVPSTICFSNIMACVENSKMEKFLNVAAERKSLVLSERLRVLEQATSNVVCLCHTKAYFFTCTFIFHTVTDKHMRYCMQHMLLHTYRVHGACRRPLISILICLSHCWFLLGFLLVSAAYITWMRWPSTTRAKGGVRRGGHYHTVCLHQCTISIISPVIETNHSLTAAVAQATHIQIAFRCSRKLKWGGN